MMDKLVAEFPAQLEEALQIGAQAKIRPHAHPIYKAHAAGLGGSGIGANFVQSFIRSECAIPYTVSKGYDIPAHVDQHTLAIASSYSGNTEETLASFAEYLQSGAKIVVVASGGKLINAAQEHDLDYIQLPSGKPSPRACLGYSLVQQLFIFQKLGFIGVSLTRQIAESAQFLLAEQPAIQEKAREVAQGLHGTLPIIYATDRISPVAVRFRQQLNENSKMLCWHHILPEMNHNELVGWKFGLPNSAVVYLRNEDDLHRNQVRMGINQKIIQPLAGKILEVYSKGRSLVEQSMYLVHLVDWVSVYLAELNQVDPNEIQVIDYLKGELAKV